MSETQYRLFLSKLQAWAIRVIASIFLSAATLLWWAAQWSARVEASLQVAEKDRQEMREVVRRQTELNQFFVQHIASVEALQGRQAANQTH